MFSEEKFKKALKALSWTQLQAHLDEVPLAAEDVGALCELIRHESDLIFKYPSPKNEGKRAVLFSGLRAYFDERFGTSQAEELDTEIALLDIIEHGFRSIIASIQACPISKRPPAVRVAACLSRGGQAYLEILEHSEAMLKAGKPIVVSPSTKIAAPDGSEYSSDGVLTTLSRIACNTIVMEAFRNKWFDGDLVRIPALPAIGSAEQAEAGDNDLWAMCWRAWEEVQKRQRYLGGELSVYAPKTKSDQVSVPDAVITYAPLDNGASEVDVYDYIANVRLQDWMFQTYTDMMLHPKSDETFCGIAGPCKLPPVNRISLDEVHGDIALCELLGYDITKDFEQPGGIRLLEWVRGYAVLKMLAVERTAAAKTGADMLVVLPQAELIEILERCGLNTTVAQRFLDCVSLRRDARDMFDCPVVRLGTDAVMLYAPVLSDLNICMTVLSNLANQKADLGQKGEAFENATLDFLRRQGLASVTFEFKRDGQQYQYDVVLPWQGKLFVIECKNRSLSAHDPAAAYYFDREVQSQAKQVRRLADALKRWPEELARHVGAQFADYEIVPVILHSMPYARFETLDGVYFTDASALHRFFKESHFRINRPFQMGGHTVLHRVALREQWEGDAPSAEDFLVQMARPYQLEISAHNLDLKPREFWVSPTELVRTADLVRDDITLESTCETLGLDVGRVEDEFKNVKAAALEAYFKQSGDDSAKD